MPSITVRNVPDDVHRALRVRAARHGRSPEAELRDRRPRAVAEPLLGTLRLERLAGLPQPFLRRLVEPRLPEVQSTDRTRDDRRDDRPGHPTIIEHLRYFWRLLATAVLTWKP